jgi:hypothetical protein
MQQAGLKDWASLSQEEKHDKTTRLIQALKDNDLTTVNL